MIVQMKIYFLFAFLISVATISGCRGGGFLDVLTVVDTFNEATKPNKPLPPAKVVAEDAMDEEKFYNSEHNWNNTKTVKVEKSEVKPEPQKREKKEVKDEPKREMSIPLPLILIALLSGGMYFINSVRYYLQNRKEQ